MSELTYGTLHNCEFTYIVTFSLTENKRVIGLANPSIKKFFTHKMSLIAKN